MVVARGSRSQSDLQQAATATSTASTGTQHSSGQEQARGWRKSESAASVVTKGAAEAPRKRSESKDYNKHWLIQEAEQRRISEAKQKQNLSTSSSSTNTSTNTSQGQIDKLENINNNHRGFGEKRVNNTISDNIYANVDPSNISYSSDPR